MVKQAIEKIMKKTWMHVDPGKACRQCVPVSTC